MSVPVVLWCVHGPRHTSNGEDKADAIYYSSRHDGGMSLLYGEMVEEAQTSDATRRIAGLLVCTTST